MEDTECIYDEVRSLVAVSPTKTPYDSKESVFFIFNKPFLARDGTYEAEFKGERHCIRVPAVLLNSCTIQTHAPVYYPPEPTTVTLYDKVKQHEPPIAQCPFEFFSRSQVLEELLEKSSSPEQLLCDSLGISTADMTMFDEVMARKIQLKSPNDFNLLEIPQTGQAEVAAHSSTKYPTLVHFGAAHGLPLTVAACLQHCPAAQQACALKNIDGMRPVEMAVKLGHYELSEDIQDFESNKQRYEKKTLSTHVAVDNYHDVDTEDTYVTMGPNMALDGPDNQYDYVTMPGAGVNKTDTQMTPDLQKAIFIAEQAVNESWRNSNLREETVQAFRQLIQHCDGLSPIYDVPCPTRPALPPKLRNLNYKRHSIHDIPSSAPPLPPRSPRSPKSPPFPFGELALGETRGHGSDPNIFHRMQHLDALTIREETTVQRPRTPQPPRKSKCSLSSRGMNGIQRYQPGSPNGFLPQKSLDATPMGSSPRLPPRASQRGPVARARTMSCEPALPRHNPVKTRSLSEPDEHGFVTIGKLK